VKDGGNAIKVRIKSRKNPDPRGVLLNPLATFCSLILFTRAYFSENVGELRGLVIFMYRFPRDELWQHLGSML
jgi:hypothetical protein